MPPKVVAVIPAFRTPEAAIEVVREALEKFDAVIVVDDACPEESGKKIEAAFPSNDRLTVLFNKVNLGVGGATKCGIDFGIAKGADIIVKVDSDGQMDLQQLDRLLSPILLGEADMAKGNRFSSRENLAGMPLIRLFGNSFLTFLNRASTGLWNISDPTNGYLAISEKLARELPWHKISDGYAFETEVLFRVGLTGYRLVDIPMASVYTGAKSSMNPLRLAPTLALIHGKQYLKRLTYQYLIYEINPGTFYLGGGMAVFLFGASFGAINWLNASSAGEISPPGTVGITLVSLILGFQLLLQFFTFDTMRDRK